jgi:hypothetical protein
MALTTMFLKSDALQRSQVQELNFYLKITGAKTNAALSLVSYPLLAGYDAADLTQVLVEGFLGHTSTAACATIFDATSLGTDAFGFVIDMQGQCGTLLGYQCAVVQTAGGTPANTSLLTQASQTALTSALTSVCAAYDGDIYGRVVAGNLDSATAGYIHLRVLYRSK